MTLQNGFVAGGELRLYCDTAWLEVPSGKVAGFGSKAIGSQTLFPYAICSTIIETGEMGATLAWLTAYLDQDRPHDTDSLINSMNSWMAGYIAAKRGICRLLIGSWGAHDNVPHLHLLASDELAFAKPGEAVELLSYVSSGNGSETYRAGCAHGFDGGRMLDMIDTQRAERMQTDWSGSYYGIGGAAVEITVNRFGVGSSVVRSWPDAIGAPIDPVRDIESRLAA